MTPRFCGARGPGCKGAGPGGVSASADQAEGGQAEAEQGQGDGFGLGDGRRGVVELHFVQQDPAGEGKAAVDALMTLKKGGTIDPIINVPVTIVTKDNVAGFKSMFE